MPSPISTKLPDQIGPLQPFPLEVALSRAYDVSQDCYWAFCEGQRRIFKMLTEVQQTYKYAGGVRVVYERGQAYVAMCVELVAKSSPADDYDRAMSIIKH